MYFKIRAKRKDIKNPPPLSRTGIIGLNWAGTGGEATSLLTDNYLAADGIENCIKVLDEIEHGTIRDLDFVELNACNGGCVGGTLNVENPYIAKARLRSLRKFLPIARNKVTDDDELNGAMTDTDFYVENSTLSPKERIEAIAKMARAEEIYKELPHLDCGSCGAPTCHALAEDVINCEASEADCLIKLRERFNKE